MAELVLKNGKVYTVDADRSWAQAVAIEGGNLVYVGPDEGVEAYIDSDTVVLDLEEKMVLPGFIDAHAHPSLAMDLIGNVSMYNLYSLEAYKEAVVEYVAKHPDAEIVRGSGWDNTVAPIQGPDKGTLDAIVPDRPASFTSNDGHSLWVNSAALALAGITKDTPDPHGGVIERDPETGEPSGTLREKAMDLVNNVLPEYAVEEYKNTILAYQEMAAKVGITGVHDAMLDARSIQAYDELASEGQLKMRFRGSITLEPERGMEQVGVVVEGRDKNTHPYFQIPAGKIFVDGVVEGGTAFLLEPYANQPDFYSEPIWGVELLNQMCAALDKEGLQIHVHVIGDAATRMTLDALEYAQQENGKRDSRHLMVHIQLVAPEDLPRFASLGVVGLPSPFWFNVAEYFWDLEVPYLGRERANREYPMQSLLDAGAILASASDFPVTIPFDPLIGIQMGVNRSTVGDPIDPNLDLQPGDHGVLGPEERASLEDMIVSFTYNGAYANFMENEVGSLETGKQADLVVLGRNIFEIPTTEIAETKVLMTLVAGEEVYRDSTF